MTFHHEKRNAQEDSETHHGDSTTHRWRQSGWWEKSGAGGLTSANSELQQRVNKQTPADGSPPPDHRRFCFPLYAPSHPNGKHRSAVPGQITLFVNLMICVRVFIISLIVLSAEVMP